MDLRASSMVRRGVGWLLCATVMMLWLLGADLAVRDMLGYVNQAIQQQYVRGVQVLLAQTDRRVVPLAPSLEKRFDVGVREDRLQFGTVGEHELAQRQLSVITLDALKPKEAAAPSDPPW